MTRHSLVLRAEDLKSLQENLLKDDKKERAAFLLFGIARIGADPWTKESGRKYLLRNIFPLDARTLVHSTSTSVTWDNNGFVQTLKKAKEQDLTVGVIHSHPEAARYFSSVDDKGETGLHELAVNRNGTDTEIVSLVLPQGGNPIARVWSGQPKPSTISPIVSVGDRISWLHGNEENAVPRAFQRQALAFGPSLTSILHGLRIAVIGCGGTGSAVATLLARLGVGHISLVDHDRVEESNLNRLYGATIRDARSRRPKVDVVKRAIQGMGLSTKVATYQTRVGDLRVRDALKSSDVIFGCTDDHLGRILLNRFAYFYLVPVIDVGLAISVSTGDRPEIQALDVRVTVLLPGNTCLLCRKVVSPEVARAEYLKRANPKEYQRQKKEAYVLGEGNPNPSVVTFTTEVATMAVNELLQRIQGFRGPNGANAQRTRMFHRQHDLRQGDKPDPDCPICARNTYWARGDLDPFLDQVG